MKYNGKKCNNCGSGLRYKSNNKCVSCHLEKSKKYNRENKDKLKKYFIDFHNRNPDYEQLRIIAQK